LALRYAEAVALRGHGTLTVTYANDPLLIAAAAAALHDRQLAKRSAAELQAFADAAIASRSRRQLRLRVDVSVGSPTDAILKTAAARRSDLIVIGTHGLTGADRLLMGSTTLGLLQRSTVPVLAIPPETASLSAPASTWPGRLVMAPLELDALATRDAETAARLARWFGASLLLVHAVQEISVPAWLHGDMSAHDRIRVAQAQRQLEALTAGADRFVNSQSRVVAGRVAEELAALAASERVGLLVTALRDRRGWFGARRGSVSYQVLSFAVAPVLTYPQQWRVR
jgi:nucleotide-binding universal stress UspA family protein